MRDSHYIPAYDKVASAVIAIGNDYSADHIVQPHSHKRSQLIYGANGVMMVVTEHGVWIVPPEQAVWLPAGVVHSVHMTMGPVSTHSAFIWPDSVPRLPKGCQVLGMSPLMKQLLREAVDVPLEYDPTSRDGLLMALLQQEIPRLPVLPLALPFPRDKRLARRCRKLLDQPTPHDSIDEWSDALGMSRRAFTRLFRHETGMSFAAWRQQACLFAALPRLAAGESITVVALDLGYDSPAAFTSMFRRALGAPPSRYFNK